MTSLNEAPTFFYIPYTRMKDIIKGWKMTEKTNRISQNDSKIFLSAVCFWLNTHCQKSDFQDLF